MSLSQSLIPEFTQEMATTRRLLERLPEDKLDWRPHPKSFALGALATHIAQLPSWTRISVSQDSLDIEPEPGKPYKAPILTSRAEILDLFDKHVADARAALEETDDATFMQPWTLLKTGQKIFTLPKVGVIRTMVFNHIIHHRGQFSVYLRLNDVPLPSIYGPTADEPF